VIEPKVSERILAIVNILAEYALETETGDNEGEMIETLLAQGFAAEEIDAAFHWLENLKPQDSGAPGFTPPDNHRVFSDEELLLLSREARGFLIRLRSLGLLDESLQEDIINKAMQMAEEEISLTEIKALTAMSLYNRSLGDWHREVDILLDEDWSSLYH